MRKVEWAPFMYIGVVFGFETLHTVGLGLLFYGVLPNLDTLRAIMLLNAVFIVPAILGIFRPNNFKSSAIRFVVLGLDVLAVLFQLGGLIVWPVLNQNWDNGTWKLMDSWALPLGLFLTSFGWWESFVDESVENPLTKFLWRVKINMIEEGTR